MHGLAVSITEGHPFTQDISFGNSEDSYLCFYKSEKNIFVVQIF